MKPLELWGGHECTVNRVGDVWRDQTKLSGHEERIDDLDRFASLGLRTLRYPIVWERTELSPGVFDWSWADARMSRIQALGIRPIVGLVHHGSGPTWTHLLHDGFASGLARFALQVARRYPWIDAWTPVNEPLTTARFSALYGHWYPHHQDEASFWRALVNQIDASNQAMAAVRLVNPRARLIQTEDFGCTFGTEECGEQAAYENARRLMSWDLQTGRVDEDHLFWRPLVHAGLERELHRLRREACPPDLLGVNHYITSDRFLDHRVERYPSQFHGGNGRIRYADIEAVRVVGDFTCGWTYAFQTLWARYRLPMAVTECHLGCDEEEQVRWLKGCWDAAVASRQRGVPIEAVTAWSLLGAVDWDSLLTLSRGHYEPGVFDVSNGRVRPTALARMVRDLAANGVASPDQPLGEGWWRSQSRLLYPQARPHRESLSLHMSPQLQL